MWTEDPKEQADAIKLIASVLKHQDINMVHKAAGALCERGAIGVRYLNMAAADPQLNEVARVAILVRARMSAEPFRQVDMTWDNLADQAQEVVSEALKEVRYHQFSSIFMGVLPARGSLTLQYAFEIDLSRPVDMQALISFKYRKSEERAKDEDSIPVVRAFAQNTKYRENLDLPRNTEIRYFCWELMSREEKRLNPQISEREKKYFNVPNMYGLTLETAIRCGHSPSPTLGAYMIKFFTVGAGLEEDLKYLAKVRCPAGLKIQYLPRQQILAEDGSCVRWFVVACECGEHQAFLYVDSLRSGELMPPDLPGWSIDPAGTPTPKDEMQEMDLIFIGTIKDFLLMIEPQCKQKASPFSIMLDPGKSSLKITFKPDGINPLPRFAALGCPPRPQPEFAVFQPNVSLEKYHCEFWNIKEKGEYYLHFLAFSQSIYAKKEQ